MSDAVLIAGVSAAAALIGATVTSVVGALAARRSARDATRIDAFEASIAGLKLLIDGQEQRIGALERELDTVKTALVAEQQQHAATRELLRIALRHIRDMLSWLGGDRAALPPAVPDELTHQL